MFRDPADHWHYSEDRSLAVDFCVRVLILDGLHVPPFDAHPGRSHGLDCSDLTPTVWLKWLFEVVAGQGRIRELTVKLAGKSSAPSTADRTQVLRLASPAKLWPGSEATARRLADEWERHLLGDESRGLGEIESQRGRRAAEHRLLWEAMGRFRDHLPPLSFFWVDYPAPAVCIVPPNSAVIGSAAAETTTARTSAFVQAAESLQATI
jgi:hypothetical protein